MINTFDAERGPLGFVGREHDLEVMHEWAREPGPPLLVSGPAGIGKTSLSMEYARRASSEYSRIFRSDVGRIPGLVQTIPILFSLLDRAVKHNERLNPEGPIQEPLYGGNRRGPALIIFDEVPDSHDQVELMAYIRHFAKNDPQFRWIVIARSATPSIAVQPGQDYNHLRLSGLSAAEIDRLISLTAGAEPNERYLREARQLLHQRLSGNPSYIVQALRALQEHGSLSRITDLASDAVSEGVTTLIVTPTEDRLAVIPATQLDLHGIIIPEFTYLVAPYIIVPRASVYWRQQLAEFEDMLNDPSLKEADYQDYFERNPHFLTGVDYRQAIPHPILKRELEADANSRPGDLIPDFFLQPVDRQYADILDLKLPTQKLVVGQRNRLRHSASVQEALSQVREYRDYFDDPKQRAMVKEKYGLTAYRPTAAVIIGRRPQHIEEEKMRQIDDQLPGYAKILTYDQLFAKMKEMVYLYSI